VQLSVEEYRELVLAAYQAGWLTSGEAADQLDITRPELFELASATGISTCTYDRASVEAELGNL
jgi:hypothetical protein